LNQKTWWKKGEVEERVNSRGLLAKRVRAGGNGKGFSEYRRCAADAKIPIMEEARRGGAEGEFHYQLGHTVYLYGRGGNLAEGGRVNMPGWRAGSAIVVD